MSVVAAHLYRNGTAIAKSTGLPIFLYDVPSRTACGLSDETVSRLSEIQQFIGLKDATGDVSRVSRLRALVGRDFRLLSGDDATAFAFIANGGDGCISVTSNVAPALCREMYLALRHGNVLRAQSLARPLADLTAALFLEANPIPLKYALSLAGLMSQKVRLPLVEAGLEVQARVSAEMHYVRERYDGCVGVATRLRLN